MAVTFGLVVFARAVLVFIVDVVQKVMGKVARAYHLIISSALSRNSMLSLHLISSCSNSRRKKSKVKLPFAAMSLRLKLHSDSSRFLAAPPVLVALQEPRVPTSEMTSQFDCRVTFHWSIHS